MDDDVSALPAVVARRTLAGVAGCFEVPVEEVRTASRELAAAATRLDRVRPERLLAEVAGAMPGSLTAATVVALGEAWSRRLDTLAGELADAAVAMEAVAEFAELADARAADRFSALGVAARPACERRG